MSAQSPFLFYASSMLGGRGVFSIKDLKEGEIIESCPVIILPKEQIALLDQTVLYDYYFLWGLDHCAIALGFGSLYNHQIGSNADYVMDMDNQTIDIFCVRDIPIGEEITINYNGDPENAEPVWFQEDNRSR
jgi:hypothetical protein